MKKKQLKKKMNKCDKGKQATYKYDYAFGENINQEQTSNWRI